MVKKWRYFLVAGVALVAVIIACLSSFSQNLTIEEQVARVEIFLLMAAVFWVGAEVREALAFSELRAPRHEDPEDDDDPDSDSEEGSDSVDDEEAVKDFKASVEHWLGNDEGMLQWLSEARHYMRQDNRAADDDARDLALLMVVHAYAGGREFPNEHYPAYLDELRIFIEWLKARDVWPAHR